MRSHNQTTFEALWFDVAHLAERYAPWLMALGLVTGLIAIVSILLLPWTVSRLPKDAFTRQERPLWPGLRERSPVLWTLLVAAKNTLGAAVALAGVAMLVLPGQGVLSILVGMALLDIPGKHSLIQSLVRRPIVWRALQYLRRGQGAPPFDSP